MKYIRSILAITLLITLSGCIEEVDLGLGRAGQLEPSLIVEATLTNENKAHRVVLSRMDTVFLDTQIDSTYNPFLPNFEIDRDFVNYETNATVSVVDNNGVRYNFLEIEDGVYESEMAFAAQEGQTYKLEINTVDGARFESQEMAYAGESELTDIYAEKTVSGTGVEGLGIYIDNRPISGNTDNFRYTYDETYKIIAPLWSAFEFRLSNYDPCAIPVQYTLEIRPREREERVCYRTDRSNSIIQAKSRLESSGLNRQMIRFLAKDNFAISHRYSIEVSQMVSSNTSFSFYEQLNAFSEQGNLFSQVQPGFIEGNIVAMDGDERAVIGFFDVVSVNKRRLFFNYEDFYPGEPLPPYVFNCNEQSVPESHESYCSTNPSANPCPQSIIERVNLDLIDFVRANSEGIGSCPGPHIFTNNICGDCTWLGSNVVPEFWTEE
ncbi:MAG: DUF4249 domain-containing protein [Bacteroidota bacterium]